MNNSKQHQKNINNVGTYGQWSNDFSNYNEKPFSPNNPPGPYNIPETINIDSSPADYLSLYWTNELWNLFLSETNKQARRLTVMNPDSQIAKILGKMPVTLTELKAFFGLRVSMELLLYKNRYEEYWRTKNTAICFTPGYGQVMARDRFLAIWACLHAVDEEDPNLNKADKIYKVRPVFDHLIARFKHFYVPYGNLSLDEGMVPTKNKLSIKQYIKDKPIRWGIKTYLLCDSMNGYIMNAEIYTGKATNGNIIESLGVTGNLVVRLVHELQGQNYTIFTDRFYTSVKLAEYLMNLDIQLCGTAMTNRKDFPKALIKK
jgi:hypothetical protein